MSLGLRGCTRHKCKDVCVCLTGFRRDGVYSKNLSFVLFIHQYLCNIYGIFYFLKVKHIQLYINYQRTHRHTVLYY